MTTEQTFTLDTFFVRVDVCGIPYYVENSCGDVCRDISKAFHFSLFGAQRASQRWFPGDETKTEIIPANIELRTLPEVQS